MILRFNIDLFKNVKVKLEIYMIVKIFNVIMYVFMLLFILWILLYVQNYYIVMIKEI